MVDPAPGNPMSPLAGKRIAIPETRQQDILAELLSARGADVRKVPLVGIFDAPDPAPVLAWITRFTSVPPALLVLLTGEGLQRLHNLASAHNLGPAFMAGLCATRILCRGPKPARVARALGLPEPVPAAEPTTEGVITTLATMDLRNLKVAVQLYGQDPNTRLVQYLLEAGAVVDTVAPYIYADQADEEKVVALIHALAEGKLDAIAFTSQPQLRRLQTIATKHALTDRLQAGLQQTVVAAVGPVVKDQLEAAGFRVDVMPERTWFMKPLVTALSRHFGQGNSDPV
jgi:uroporphyrinogen-III synthase